MNIGVPCRFHGSAKGCRYGINCGYSHNYPQSIPLCKFTSSVKGCRRGNQCHFRHSTFPNWQKIQSVSKSSQQSSKQKEDQVIIKTKLSPIVSIQLQFIFAFSSDNIIGVAHNGIYHYNVHTNKWKFYRKYPTDFKPHTIDSVAFDHKNKHLYFISHKISTLPSYNVFTSPKHQILQRFAITDDEQLQTDSDKIIFERFLRKHISNAIVINGEYHVFTSATHYILNKATMKFDAKCVSDSQYLKFKNSKIFFVSKKDMII
eukprot:233320_1